MPEVYSDNFSTTLVGAIGSTSRPVTFTVAATSPDLAGGTFSIIIFDVGTDANPTHAEILEVVDGSSTSWTASPEPGHTATTHASGSTVRQVLTRRSITQQMVDHVDTVGSPDPHVQYVRESTFSAKGDSLVGTGTATFTREAVGADGTALIADSTQVTGRRWGIPGLSTILTHMGDLIQGGVAGAAARLGIGTSGQVLTALQNALSVANPSSGPTCSAGSSGGTLVNGTSYDFAFEWSNGTAPDGGNTLPSARTTFAATSTGRVNVQAPAAPTAGLTLHVYMGSLAGTLFRVPGTIPNASTSTPNVVTVSAVVSSGTVVDTANTTGGLSAVWSTPSGGAVMVASGVGHAAGLAPDPGASAATTHYLREDATWAIPPGGFTNPMTTLWDMIVGGASGVATRMGVGSVGQILTVTAGPAIAWSRAVDVMTAIGDLITGGTGGAPTRLAPGTSGTFLQSNGAGVALSWGTPAGGGGATGSSGSPYHEEFAPTLAATTVTLTNTPSTILNVFRNGVAQSTADNDYTASGSVITFTTAFLSGERVVVTYIGLQALLTPTSNLLYAITLTTATATIDTGTLSQSYRDLRVSIKGRGDTAATDTNLQIRFNGDSGTNYDYTEMYGSNTTPTAAAPAAGTFAKIAFFDAASAPSGNATSCIVALPNYTDSTFRKTGIAHSTLERSDTPATNNFVVVNRFVWRSTSAITSLQLSLAAGNFVAGTTVFVYGDPVSAGGSSVGTGTRLRIGSNQSATTATATTIGWDTEDVDADNQHFTSSAALTGTVAKTAASNVLTGTSTLFTTELSVGQVISVPGTAAEVAVVTSIASATSLTVNTPFANSASGQTATRLNSPVVFRQPGFYTLESTIYSAAVSTGNVTLQFRLNGTTIVDQKDQSSVNAAAGYELVTQRQFQQWDYVEVIWTQNSGGSVSVTADERTHFSINARPTIIVAIPYVNIQDQKAQNTAGGTFTSGAFQTRTLNTVQSDIAGVSTLATNQVTLLAGTYRVRIECPAYRVGQHQSRLQNITDSATTLIGTSNVSQTTIDAMCTSLIAGKFTIAGTKTFEIQHRCTTTGSSSGFGLAANFTTEVYTVAEFWKEG